jgi:hypothetical protein
MAALADRPAAKITTREIDELLATISVTGASAATVNKYRSAVSAVFNHGCKPSTFALPANPAIGADRRREPAQAPLVFYSPEENRGHRPRAGGGTTPRSGFSRGQRR